MREALGALPCVKQVQVDFGKKQATVTVEAGKVEDHALIQVLEKEGFGGKVLK